MIVVAFDTPSISCDAPGCNRSQFMTANRCSTQNSSLLDKLLQKVARDGWMVFDSGQKILHLCDSCGRAKDGAIPMSSHVKPDGNIELGQSLQAGTAVALDENGELTPATAGGLSEAKETITMYKIEHLKQYLPYCIKIDFDIYNDSQGDVRMAKVKCHFINEMKVVAQCSQLPPSTEKLIELVSAAAQQCLSDIVQAATFSMYGRRRIITRDPLAPNGARVTGRRFHDVPLGAPSLREIMTTMSDVIDVDGHDVSSTASNKKKPMYGAGSLTFPEPAQLPAPAPALGKLDKEKARRATEAMGDLLSSVWIDDD